VVFHVIDNQPITIEILSQEGNDIEMHMMVALREETISCPTKPT
jgi:hypothetical protein